MHLVVTGATGYIGSRLCAVAVSRGVRVTALSRRKPALTEAPWQRFDLHSDEPLSLPPDATALIHLAATTTPDFDVAREVAAVHRLVRACQNTGVRLIFVSSQTASPTAATAYGRSKWRIEQDVRAAGGCVVRPGQVYGGAAEGLFGSLIGMVKKLPVLPAFLPAPKVQPVHVDDLCQALLDLAARDALHGACLQVAQAEPVSFTAFLKAIAKHRLNVRRLWLPVPSLPIVMAARLMGSSLAAKTGLARLSSLFSLPAMDTRPSLETLGLVLREFPKGMRGAASPQTRALLREGYALLKYCLRAAPPAWLCRRYARAVMALHGGSALDWPWAAYRCPARIAFVDVPASARNPDDIALRQRIAIAIAVAEASPQGYRRFNRAEVDSNPLSVLVRVGFAGGMGVLIRVLALAVPRWLKPRLPKGRHDDR